MRRCRKDRCCCGCYNNVVGHMRGIALQVCAASCAIHLVFVVQLPAQTATIGSIEGFEFTPNLAILGVCRGVCCQVI